jgi:hypothetical protein
MIHNVHGSIHGTGSMSDAFVDFLPHAIQRQQLFVLSFDQESTLTKWTLGDFALFLKHQTQLRALFVPQYTILEDKPSDFLPANSDGSKGLFVLTKRRATQVRHSGSKGPPLPFNAPAILQKLDPAQLTQNITVSIGIKFQISHHPRTQDIFLNCGAPLPLAHQLLTSAQQNGGAINTICIAKNPSKKDAMTLSSQIHTIFQHKIDNLQDLTISCLEIGMYARVISLHVNISRLRSLAIHNCPKSQTFLQHLAELKQLRLETFIYHDTKVQHKPFDREKFLETLSAFLSSFTGLRHLCIEMSIEPEDITKDQSSTSKASTTYDWNLPAALSTQKETISSIYLRCGRKRYDYTKDLSWLATNCILLTDLGLPLPAISNDGRHFRTLDAHLKDLAASLELFPDLQYIYLVGPEVRNNLQDDPKHLETVARRVAYTIKKHSNCLRYVTCALRNPRGKTVEQRTLRIARGAGPEKEEVDVLCSEASTGRDMLRFGDPVGFDYVETVREKTGRS